VAGVHRPCLAAPGRTADGVATTGDLRQGDAQSRLCWSSLCLIDSRRVGSGDRRGCV